MSSAREALTRLGHEIRADFSHNRRVMSFAEYLDLCEKSPRIQLRSAPQYVADCFRHYGTEDRVYPWGTIRRFKLFDCPWASGRERLIGHEDVQNRVFRSLSNFVNEGTSNRLILLHGPNGSAKSTLVRCIGRALQDYSTLDHGALYRINWLFPGHKLGRGDIGFAPDDDGDALRDTYAYLPDEKIDAKLPDELRDHPLLLLPLDKREPMLERMLRAASEADGDGDFVLSDYLRYGRLSHKNRAIYEALLTSYHGDYLEVLRHVQIERFFIQHRYRQGYVTVEPQLSVDATERQVTADRSLAALPSALQSVSLYEYGGQVVNANRGLIEYSDLLKRPLEAYKYLLTTVERASVHLPNASLYLDVVFVGTSNDIHLDGFKKSAEFLSFKGRLDLVRVPYLRDFKLEQAIYADRIREAAGTRHVAPHCGYVAALWAVLTRLKKPTNRAMPERVHAALAALGPVEKAELYAEGRIPDRLDLAEANELRAHLDDLMHQTDDALDYEGRIGASPREMLGAIFNAATSTAYSYVSPLAILDELAELTKQTSVYRFLEAPSEDNGYREPRAFIDACRDKLIDTIDREVRSALGLIDESEYERVFERYIRHVMHWTKGEKLTHPVTGRAQDADESLMRSVEDTLGVSDRERDEVRRGLITRIGAWSLDHRDEKPDYSRIFADHFKRLAADYFDQRKKVVAHGIETVLAQLTDNAGHLDDEDSAQARATIDRLTTAFGYNEASARDAVSLLFRTRYR